MENGGARFVRRQGALVKLAKRAFSCVRPRGDEAKGRRSVILGAWVQKSEVTFVSGKFAYRRGTERSGSNRGCLSLDWNPRINIHFSA